jgi:hypothetical protein
MKDDDFKLIHLMGIAEARFALWRQRVRQRKAQADFIKLIKERKQE